MNSGATSERVHDAIKRWILTRAFHPGQRLEPALLAQSLSSSITPIRDALHLLVGSGFVETGTGDGFHVPHIDEPALQDLYDWNLEVLTLAIRSWPRERPQLGYGDGSPGDDPATTIANIADDIARRSSNAEHLRAVQSLNDRLHPLRMVEPIVLKPADDELDLLAAAVARYDGRDVRRHLSDYHRRRRRRAAEIVRAHYRR